MKSRKWRKTPGNQSRSSKARGELFFIVDSDDYLTNTSLEIVDQVEKAIPKEQKKILPEFVAKGDIQKMRLWEPPLKAM